MTERATYWAAQLAAWERSGLTQAEYCRRHRIKAGNFGWWKRQLLGPSRQRHKQPGKRTRPYGRSPTRRGRLAESSEAPTRPGPLSRSPKLPERKGQPTKSPERAKRRVRSAKLSASFVELPLTSAFPASTYELVLVGGRAIRIPSQFDPETLSRLISVVESC